MDSLSTKMLNMTAPCVVTYDKTGLISDFSKAASGTKGDDFQKLMEKAQSGQTENRVEERPKAKTETTAKKAKAPAEKEEPAADPKQLQVYLVPLTQEQLSQIPAEWLPANLEEGEPVVCIGVRTGENGEDVPILMGANEAAQRYGKEVVAPWQTFDVSDPEADAMLEATAPGADNSPAAMLEKLVDEEIGQVAQTAVEEAKPQEKDDDQVELVDVEQGSQRIFHDVEAAPVKVGEAEGTEQTNAADVVQQVNDQIAQAIQSGESTVTVRLNPENLGEVTVQVSMKSDGILNVAISARNDDTRALLERHAANLQEMVSSRTQQSVEVNVQRQQESQQNQNQQSYDGHNGHAQDGQERRRRQHEQTNPQDFMQQLRLGLIPTDGEI
ncbi:MAG: flagellar hook-length control protein FliK [Oscillospiraceae bacterium]|nr:flagellar hook-length control protein FliK [Oscillospiraceae bacterium]